MEDVKKWFRARKGLKRGIDAMRKGGAASAHSD